MKRVLIAICTVAALLMPLAQASASSTLVNNLAAFWDFDESSGNAADASGNSNTLANTNTATYGTGVINNAVNLSAASSQSLQGLGTGSTVITGDISFSFWVNPNNLPGLGQQQIFINKEGAYMVRYYRNQAGDGGLYGLDVALNATGINTACANLTITTGENASPEMPASTWTHIVITYNHSSGAFVIYKNGISAWSGTGSVCTITSNSNTLQIGLNSSTFNNGNYFTTKYTDAKFDAMGIWSRLLTGPEVSSLYNGGAGLQYPFNPTFTYSFWQFMTFPI